MLIAYLFEVVSLARYVFNEVGMGVYFYDLFSKLIPDQAKEKYNNGCTYIIYSRVLVLEYGGGVVGPQCFP